ncbi:MAG: hypothetical protein ACI8UO_002788 [Verrucomicrobiales bacterium]|jgi:hypothetical protein
MKPRSIAFFTLLVFVCLARSSAQEETNWKQFTEENAFKNAYGIYLDGKKLGWTLEEFYLDEVNGREIAVTKSIGEVRVELLGETMEMTFSEEFHYSLNGEGELISANSRSSQDGQMSNMQAKANDDGFSVAVEIEGSAVNFQTLPSGDSLATLQKELAWIREERKPGDEIEIASFDLEKITGSDPADRKIDPDESEPHRYVGGDFERVGGVETLVHRIAYNMQGAEVEASVLPDGTLLNGFFGPFELRLEDEEIAKQFDVATINSLSIVPVETELGEPTEVETLTLRITGSTHDFPQSDRQEVVSIDRDAKEVVLRLHAELDDSVTHELSEEELRKYTTPTANIQSDHPKIRKRAAKITRGKKAALQKVAALNSWVFNQLSFDIADNSSTALRVLETKTGDCTECALLLVAFARSQGIPAREIGGFTYAEEYGAFWAHAWVQVHDGTRWIDVDPAWDEVGVNATHIQTSIADQPMADMSVFGGIEIEVVDFERKK